MEERLARISGATLGYIWNNIPGAIDGYYAAGAAYRMRNRYLSYRNKRKFNATNSTSILPPRKRFRLTPLRKENTTTTQYDTTTQYRYKRMPKRRRRRWKRFVKKVQAVQEKTLGLRTVLFNTNIRISGAANQQHYGCVALYGYQGVKDDLSSPSTQCGLRDIHRMANNDTDIMDPGTGGYSGGKFTFRSAVCDVTATNVGARSLEVDLYEITVGEDDTKTGSPVGTIGNAQLVTDDIPTAATPLDLAQRGATLFDLPNAISMDKWKIYKKRKYFLPSGSSFTFQHRDAGSYTINGADMKLLLGDAALSYARRKMTRLFIFVCKNVAGYDNSTVDLQIGATRKYSYIINASSKTYDSFNPPQV